MDPGEKAGVVFRWLSIVTILAYLYLSRAAVRRSGARLSLLTYREIGVRTTMIQSRMQDVKIIENSKIGDVINKTKLNSFVYIPLMIPCTESLERIEAILAAELPKIGSRMDKIISGPIYCGVSDVSTSSQPPRESVMTLAISAECLQKDYFEVKKYVYREVLLLCQREHIPLT